MQNRKFGIIAALMGLSVIIGGCTTTYLSLKSWEGRSVKDLYFEWGPPDSVDVTDTGKTAYIWVFERTVDGQVKTCEKSFYTRNTGNAEVIVDTSYKDCLFLIAK